MWPAPCGTGQLGSCTPYSHAQQNRIPTQNWINNAGNCIRHHGRLDGAIRVWARETTLGCATIISAVINLSLHCSVPVTMNYCLRASQHDWITGEERGQQLLGKYDNSNYPLLLQQRLPASSSSTYPALQHTKTRYRKLQSIFHKGAFQSIQCPASNSSCVSYPIHFAWQTVDPLWYMLARCRYPVYLVYQHLIF